ncbi:MAG: MBL fold metallo-hydrolase [bacterium]|nr:MBL fold metallo-hydrolase [bacterium]
MVITYLGKQFFKLQLGDTTLAVNPISKESKHKTSRFGADIALVTVNHPDYNGVENLSFGDREPFVANGPGEYEIKEIFIKGFPSESMVGLPAAAGRSAAQAGGEKRQNTIYTLAIDKMNVCFLGALSSKELKTETREGIDGVDILFVPIGGKGTLGPADAYQVAVSFEPKLIIPMDYEEGSEELKKFLKEGGSPKTDPVDKLTVKQKDLEGREGEIVLLIPSL